MELLLEEKEEVLALDPKSITPNPAQPRRDFSEDELFQLADSVKQFGVLQPLTVRPGASYGTYELVAGERRLRAAILAGVRTVPCRLVDADERESAEIAIVENLQRKDLNPFEEASAISALLDLYGMTQEKLAARLSVSQSYIANKLRLLRLSEDERRDILAASLSERHARALLRIPGGPARRAALNRVISRSLNVGQTERLVDEILAREGEEAHKKTIKGAIGDLRLFYNSLDRALGILRSAGMLTNCEKHETDDGVDMTIRIKRK